MSEIDQESVERTSLPSEPFQVIVVDNTHGGARLDKFLVDSVPSLSRARVKAMIEGGQIRVDGRRARKGDAVATGQQVALLSPPPPRDFDPVPEPDVKLTVLYQDDAIIVLDKPAGVPTHPLDPHETGTMANAIIAHFPETAGVGFARREPGLLHRLDSDTSGVLVVARTQEAFDAMRTSTRMASLRKRYIALVEGTVPAEGRVDFPLVPHRKDPRRVEAVTPHVRLRAGTRTFEAETTYRPLRAITAPEGPLTLIEVDVGSAFRHQIRVHLATVGHPLYADALYKGPAADAGVTLDRHFLHASVVELPHPTTGETLRVEAPLPNDLAAALAVLERR
ncbi:MAG: RluA family pseudouridine synthase [Deltaproteobacteria bacterium]|nr:RluA family pseudouridine synthase [Deltaproteobacteria bacterium]